MAWWKKHTDIETKDQEESKSAVWDSETHKAISDARKAQSRNIPRAKKGEQSSEETQARVNISGPAVEQIKKMFNPDAWRAIVKAPFALGQAMTGRKCWELEKDKEDTLAVSTAMTAEYFATTDPKWLAVCICSFNWAVILTEKFAMNARERNAELALAESQQPKNPQEPPKTTWPHRAPLQPIGG